MYIYFIILCLILSLELVENTNYHRSTIVIQSDKEKKKWSLFFTVAVLILFYFSAVRFNIGADYSNYLNIIINDSPSSFMISTEYLSIWLVLLSRNNDMPFLFFIVNSGLVMTLIAKTIIDYSEDRWLSLIIFVTFPLFYLNSFSIVRFFTAVALVFYGFKYIEKGNLLRYLIVIAVAVLFHTSALIGLLFYFLRYVKIKPLHQFLIIILLPFFRNMFIFGVINFFPQYRMYLRETDIQEGTKAIYVLAFLALLCILFYNRIFSDDYKAQIYYNIFFFGVCIYSMFIEQGTLGWRFSLYGTIYSILIISKIERLVSTKYEKLFMKFIIYGASIIFLYYTLRANEGIYYPYKTILSL